jgi:hypothetical protein
MRIVAVGGLAVVASVAVGCGSATTTTTTNVSSVGNGSVDVVVTSPTSGSVIAGNSVTVRGTVQPTDATVQVEGQAAAVGNGVFTGNATLHAGKTTIDVIGSAPNATPGSTSITITQQSGGSSSSGKASSGTTGSSSRSTPGIAGEQPTPAPVEGGSSNQTSCGGGLSVGPDTTCDFAEDVESAYNASGGSETVDAYSPVTHKSYEMTCVSRARVECTGGIGASVFFSP